MIVGASRPPYRTGSGAGWVTGGAFSGDFSGGGGLTGSAVGDTGSSRGMTVYLLTGSPIRAMPDLPLVVGQEKSCARKVTSVNSVVAAVANDRRSSERAFGHRTDRNNTTLFGLLVSLDARSGVWVFISRSSDGEPLCVHSFVEFSVLESLRRGG
jgi:hypothetical protein